MDCENSRPRLPVFLGLGILDFVAWWDAVEFKPYSDKLGQVTTYRCLSTLMHLVTIARIQVFSSVSPPAFDLPGGGWNATLRPSCKAAICLLGCRPLTSREDWALGAGPTDARAGSVIDIPLVLIELEFVLLLAGEFPRGRCFRFSVVVQYWVSLCFEMYIATQWWWFSSLSKC